MKLHRFYLNDIKNLKLNKESLIELTDKNMLHQLFKVFRFRSGSEFIIFNDDNFDYQVEIESIKPALVRVKQIIDKKRENVFEINLYQALVKKDNMELITRQATELGVSSIVPLIAERSEKKSLNADRIGRIIKEAVEQSNRNKPPSFCEIVSLKDAVKKLKEQTNSFIVFHPEGKPFHKYIKTIESQKTINLFVGPEGGWSETEINFLKENGAEFVSFGSGILRAETAAVAAIAQFIR